MYFNVWFKDDINFWKSRANYLYFVSFKQKSPIGLFLFNYIYKLTCLSKHHHCLVDYYIFVILFVFFWRRRTNNTNQQLTINEIEWNEQKQNFFFPSLFFMFQINEALFIMTACYLLIINKGVVINLYHTIKKLASLELIHKLSYTFKLINYSNTSFGLPFFDQCTLKNFVPKISPVYIFSSKFLPRQNHWCQFFEGVWYHFFLEGKININQIYFDNYGWPLR